MDFSILQNNRDILSACLYALTGYITGYLFSNKLKVKLPKLLSKYAFFIAILVFILGLLIKDTNIKQALFTFSSVYLAFWLSDHQQRENDKRKEKSYLGLLWNELRVNDYILSNITKNYTFLLKEFDTLILTLCYKRYSSLLKQAQHLKNSAYLGYINASAVTTVSSDEVFNALEIAYNDTNYVKAFLDLVESDFVNKVEMFKEYLQLDAALQNIVLEDWKQKLIHGGEEIAIARRSTIKAKDLLSKYLDQIGIKTEENEIRVDTLTEEDKKFVQNIIRDKPLEPKTTNVEFV